MAFQPVALILLSSRAFCFSVVFVANPCPMPAAPASPMLLDLRSSVTSVVFVATPVGEILIRVLVHMLVY